MVPGLQKWQVSDFSLIFFVTVYLVYDATTIKRKKI